MAPEHHITAAVRLSRHNAHAHGVRQRISNDTAANFNGAKTDESVRQKRPKEPFLHFSFILNISFLLGKCCSQKLF